MLGMMLAFAVTGNLEMCRGHDLGTPIPGEKGGRAIVHGTEGKVLASWVVQDRAPREDRVLLDFTLGNDASEFWASQAVWLHLSRDGSQVSLEIQGFEGEEDWLDRVELMLSALERAGWVTDDRAGTRSSPPPTSGAMADYELSESFKIDVDTDGDGQMDITRRITLTTSRREHETTESCNNRHEKAVEKMLEKGWKPDDSPPKVTRETALPQSQHATYYDYAIRRCV